MTFRSEAHRRWWFANRGNAGGGGGGSGGGAASFSSRELKKEKDWEMVQEDGQWVLKDPVLRAQADEIKRELPPSSSPQEMAAISRIARQDAEAAASAQAQVDKAYAAYYQAENEHFDRMADYWTGRG